MSQVLQAQAIVQRITSGWRGAPPVSVVSRPVDLPVPAPDDVRGMWRAGQTFLVADTQSLGTVCKTLAHEVLGHHGLREAKGNHWRSFMNSVQGGLRAGDARLQVVREHVRASYVDDTGAFNLSPAGESDEISAFVAAYRFDGATGRLRVAKPMAKRLLAARIHFARERLYADMPASFDELEGTLLAAEHRLRHGGPFWGIGSRLRQCYDAVMAKPWNPNARLMTLAESESLLAAENYRLKSREEWKAIAMMAAAFLSICAIITLLGWWGVLIAGWVAKIALFLS